MKTIYPTHWKQFAIADCLRRVEHPVDVDPTTLYTQIGIRSHGKGLFYKEPVTGESLGNKAVYWIEPDCFVLNIVFAWEQAIGKTTQTEVGMIGSHRFPMYKPADNLVDIDYLIFYLLTKRGTDILEAASPGGAGRNRTLGQDRFLKSKIVLPPIAEQKKIAAILTTQDKVIELKEKRLAEKQRQKKFFLHQIMLHGKYGNMEIHTARKEQIGHWGVFRSGSAFPEQYQGNHHGTIPFYKVSDMNTNPNDNTLSQSNNYINHTDLSSIGAKPLPIGSIVFAKVGAALMLERKRIISVPSCIDNNMMAFIPSQSINPLYAFYWFQSTKLSKLTNEGALPSINASSIKSLEIITPSLSEQEKIVNILSTIDLEIQLMTKDLDQEKLKKKALMQLLPTGKVRVEV